MKNILLSSIAAILILSCKKGSSDGGNGPGGNSNGTPAVTEKGKTIGDPVQKMIGPDGGTITSADGKMTLTIPAGALETNTSVSMQPIESTVPGGIEKAAYRFAPHGIQFKKPAELTFKYKNGDKELFSPELMEVATQLENGTWKVAGKISIDKTAATATVPLHHFSDYDFFLRYYMQDSKTKTRENTIFLITSQHVQFDIYKTIDAKPDNPDDVFVPLPKHADNTEANVKEWAINGQINPPIVFEFGYYEKADRATAKYVAPIKAPERSIIDASAKLSFPHNPAEFQLVRQVIVGDNNQFRINGQVFTNVVPQAIQVGTFLTAGLNDTSYHNKPVYVALTINGFNGPGTYNFSKDVVVVGSDPKFGWDHTQELPNGQIVYGPGSVIITQDGDLFRCNISGTLHRTGLNSVPTSVSAIIETVLFK
ncbi:MAG TPA: hypothetical protein VD996_02265 [Chitinophagaceae bacterium]|nr:hypothetical protein [Chitinophagaceae bacterium]